MEMYGELVAVKLCKPSRRRAASNIQQPRYNKTPQQGARHAARESDQFVR